MNLTLTIACIYGSIGAVTASCVLVLFVTNASAAIQVQRVYDEQDKPWHMWFAMFVFIILVIITWPYWLVALMARGKR